MKAMLKRLGFGFRDNLDFHVQQFRQHYGNVNIKYKNNNNQSYQQEHQN